MTIIGESLLRIRHNVIAAPGTRLADIRRVLSHPVALSQCRRWLTAHPRIEVVPFYDTAGSVKHVMAAGLRDAAGIAPVLAASVVPSRICNRTRQGSIAPASHSLLPPGWIPIPALPALAPVSRQRGCR